MKSILEIQTKNRYIYSYNKSQMLYFPESLEKKANKYYKRKYEFLGQNGFFETIKDKEFDISIKPEQIKEQIANLKQLTFEITDACNLKCEYCGYGKFYENHDVRENNFFEIEKAKKLLDYLNVYWNSDLNKTYNNNMFISFYGGEPLMNMIFIKEIVNYTKNLKTKINFIYSMTTNAILLDKNIDFLVENNFWILVSLDGNKENNSYRVYHNGKECFDKIIENVDIVKEKYPEYFKKSISFNTVLHNKNSVKEVYDFFKVKYGKQTSITELNNSGIKPEMQELFFKTYKNIEENLYQSENYEKIIDEVFIGLPNIKELGIFLNTYSGYFYNDFLDFYIAKKNGISKPTGTCLPFAKKMFVTVKGKILACERIGHQFALGNIEENGNINLDFEKIASKYENYFNKLLSQCKACYQLDNCSQCVFNIATIDDEKTNCNGFTNKKNFENSVSTYLTYFEKNRKDYNKLMTEVRID